MVRAGRREENLRANQTGVGKLAQRLGGVSQLQRGTGWKDTWALGCPQDLRKHLTSPSLPRGLNTTLLGFWQC